MIAEPQRAGADARPSLDGPTDAVSGTVAPTLFGAVFCGGESRRMGRDKARIELRGRSLLQRAIDSLSPACASVWLACGPESRYDELDLERVLDVTPDGGPLAGLAAVLARAERERTAPGQEAAVAVIACDMPRATTDVYRLLHAELARSGADAALLETSEGLEPLCAVYRTSALAAVQRALGRGDRRLISFHDELRVARIRADELPEALRGADMTRNLNTPEDLSEELGA